MTESEDSTVAEAFLRTYNDSFLEAITLSERTKRRINRMATASVDDFKVLNLEQLVELYTRKLIHQRMGEKIEEAELEEEACDIAMGNVVKVLRGGTNALIESKLSGLVAEESLPDRKVPSAEAGLMFFDVRKFTDSTVQSENEDKMTQLF